MRVILLTLILFYLSLNHAFGQNIPENKIQQIVISSMQRYHVPDVSLAIINNNKIIYVKAYSLNRDFSLTKTTLFQSASIGKSVTAYGALLLVDKKNISLDTNVNDYLKTWKIPDNSFVTNNKVTLRNILDMTSGLSVSGFLGSSPNDRAPTLLQILNGEPPAENKAVQPTFEPGTQYLYSGGSYEVVQQLIEDVTQNSFPQYMYKNILLPIGMTNSQYIAILPKSLSARAIPGYLKDGSMIPGKWKIIPALGAGGLWTTPTDIAKFAINVINSYRGKPHALLSKSLAHEMLTRQNNTDFGLGFVIDGCGKNLNFRKEGHNIGFYNWLIAFPNTGQGIVVMTNSENGVPVIKAIVTKIAQLYQWPSYYPLTDEEFVIPKSSSCA